MKQIIAFLFFHVHFAFFLLANDYSIKEVPLLVEEVASKELSKIQTDKILMEKALYRGIDASLAQLRLEKERFWDAFEELFDKYFDGEKSIILKKCYNEEGIFEESEGCLKRLEYEKKIARLRFDDRQMLRTVISSITHKKNSFKKDSEGNEIKILSLTLKVDLTRLKTIYLNTIENPSLNASITNLATSSLGEGGPMEIRKEASQQLVLQNYNSVKDVYDFIDFINLRGGSVHLTASWKGLGEGETILEVKGAKGDPSVLRNFITKLNGEKFSDFIIKIFPREADFIVYFSSTLAQEGKDVSGPNL